MNGFSLKVVIVQNGKGLDGLRVRLPLAIARGLNEGGEQVRKQVQRSLWKQTGATNYSSITRRVRVLPAASGTLSYFIVVAGRPVMKISEFKWSAGAKGVQANVWGVNHLFKRSFMVDGGFKARLGRDRLPIRTLYGPNLAKELSRGATPEVFASSARAIIPPALLKQIAMVLK
jgi:hypothetical protein